MPLKKNQINKLFYSIGEVAGIFEVNTSLIRFWEKEFEIIQPKKNKKRKSPFYSQGFKSLRNYFSPS